jgi:hypothetical protein
MESATTAAETVSAETTAATKAAGAGAAYAVRMPEVQSSMQESTTAGPGETLQAFSTMSVS